MNIRGFLPSSLIEWENRVAAVIFVGGCNWRCPYCHGARLVENFESLPAIPLPEIIAALDGLLFNNLDHHITVCCLQGYQRRLRTE